MVAIGDVFSIVATLVGICVTAWAMITGAALLFQSGAYQAKSCYQRAPWKGFFAGLGVTALFSLIAFVFLALPIPFSKMIGTSILLVLMALATCGAAGIALLIADRIVALDPNISRYNALVRAGAIMAIAAVFPFFGWLFVAPILVIASVGYGTSALFARAQSSVVIK